MRRLLLAVTASALLLPAWALAQGADSEAGDTSEVDKDATGPLRERIRPVSGHLFLKKGRFELEPSAAVSLRDAFYTKYIFGGTLTYHPLETLGISLRGSYSLPVVAGSARICTETSCDPPTPGQLNGKAPGQLRLLGGLDLQWAPLYGKIALIAENFIHFDLYGLAGASGIQYGAPTFDGSAGSTPEWTLGGDLGLGMRIFINHWLTFRGEVRDLIYREDINPRPSTQWEQQLMVQVGISIFFPFGFTEG